MSRVAVSSRPITPVMRALLTLLLSCLPATSQEGAQEASRDAAAAPAIEAPSFLFLQQPAKGLPMMPAPDGYTPTAPMFMKNFW